MMKRSNKSEKWRRAGSSASLYVDTNEINQKSRGENEHIRKVEKGATDTIQRTMTAERNPKSVRIDFSAWRL